MTPSRHAVPDKNAFRPFSNLIRRVPKSILLRKRRRRSRILLAVSAL
jgi:hypothetical protein